MGYLTNRTINYLNIHGALLALLEQAWGIFGPIYLYTRGFSLTEIFILTAVLNTARIPLRFLAFPVVHRFGLKAALMLGTAGFALSFPVLGMVKGYDIWLVLYIIMFGIFSAMYWHCFHTFYSLAGESEHRGKQISVAQGLTTAIGALSPLLSSLLITHSSFQIFFLIPLPMVIVMLLILNRCENISVKRISWQHGKKVMFNIGAQIHLAEASAVFPLTIGWLFTVYFYVKEMVIFGGILTFGIIVQVLYQLWLGGALDRGKGLRIAHAAGSIRAIQLIAKALVPLSFPSVLALEGMGAAANVHHGIAQPSVMYNNGKSSADTFWYWFFAETAFDIGTIIGCAAVATALYIGMPLRLTILFALPGVCAVWWLTCRYFRAR